jgi:hypothetical protein
VGRYIQDLKVVGDQLYGLCRDGTLWLSEWDTNIETLERTHRWIPIELPPEPEYFHPSVDFKNLKTAKDF